jgi:hypothetical protein
MSTIARTIETLDRLLVDSETRRFLINWSDVEIQSQRDIAGCVVAGRTPIDPPLAEAILLCVEGRFREGAEKITAVIRSEEHLISTDNESFISTIFALYVAQQFAILAALLRDRFAFQFPLAISAEANGPGQSRVRWEISPEAHHRFVFDASSFTSDKTRNDILSLYWSFPLYTAFAHSPYREHGQVVVNQMDVGATPGAAWCDSRPDYFLVPDCIFVSTRGYAHAREVLTRNIMPWKERTPVAFWRGATTGMHGGDWRRLERAQLCEFARRYEALGVFDVGFSSIVQMPDPQTVDEIKASGLMRGFVPWESWGRFKYLIDIDGNSNPWSNLFQRLLTGSTVLKVESSRGLQQWFYDRLRPWENYVPIAPDISDLLDKILWLQRNDQLAQAIGQAGRQLALSMTFEREVERGVHTIASCFRYFSGSPEPVGPFGRPVTLLDC